MRRILPVFLFLVIAQSASAAVWPTTNRWSMAYEEKFSEMIAQVSMGVFTDPNSAWKGISTDCADAAYTLRVIFAARNGLPVNFSGLSNETSQFDSISDSTQRVRRFITAVNLATNTRTIVNDTYPIAINRRAIRAGALFVHPEGGASVHITYRPGHVYYLRDVADNGVITYFSSTVPAMVRNMDVRYGISFAPYYRTSGYRAWKWPDSSERPNYSEEQYSMAGWSANQFGNWELADRWQAAIQQRLASRGATDYERMDAAAKNAMSAIRSRATIVQAGWRVYQSRYGGQGCMSAADYDGYSTPTRDVKIQEELQNFRTYAQRAGGLAQASARYRVEILPGYTVSINDLWDAFMSRKVLAVSEPEHSPEVRWGLAEQGQWPCPHRRKQYRGAE